jgi:hypothetical protein
MAENDSPKLFRVALLGDTSLRLMEKAGDEPSTWRLPFTSGPVRLVAVRDLVSRDSEGLPLHHGFQYVVEIEHTDIDRAVTEAHSWAETAAFMLGAVSRAPVGRLFFQIAYEITPGIEERLFRQAYWNPPIPTSKPTVNQHTFGELRERIDVLGNDPGALKLLWRSILSLSWFRQALEVACHGCCNFAAAQAPLRG